MALFTTLPTRHLAEVARVLQQERDTEQYGVSIAYLLHVLRARFDQDEKAISGNLLHYQDAILEPQLQKPKVQFALPDESTEANHEERKHRVYPITPQRPDPEALAKLMEVSYTEWSDSAYEDTTGDSKLAEWLASFANKDLDLLGGGTSKQASLPLQMTGKVSLHDTSAGSGVENSLDSDLSQPFLLPAFAPAIDTPFSKHNISANVDRTHRRRALSDPPTPSKREGQPHTRSRSISHNTLSPQKKRLDSHAGPEDDVHTDSSLGVASFIKPSAFSPFSFKFMQPSEAARLTPIIESTPITPSISNIELSPVHVLRSSVPGTPLRHLVPFEYLGDEPSLHQTPSNGNGLADLSGVHAFNLSLQHASKSPLLIRTWKRMLGELAGRFPLSLSDYAGNAGSRPLIENGEGTAQLQLEVDSSDEIQDPGLASPQSLQGAKNSSTIEMPHVREAGTSGIPRVKTHADVLLDREYAGYLRGSISAKQQEVRCLQELIAQREKTIERMEFALKRRALEVLGSHEVQIKRSNMV